MEFIRQFNISVTDVLAAAAVLLDIYAISLAIYRGHGVERTLAWIFAIIALPVAGALTYLLLATPSIKRTTRRKKLSAKAVRGLLCGKDELPDASDRVVVRSMLRLAARLTDLTPSAGNRVTFLSENIEAFEHMREAVLNAKESVWTEYYIIRNDDTGSRFLELLKQKAEEGVEVRLLYDAVGSIGIDGKRLKAIRKAGGRVESFLPLNPLRRRWSVHLRNHRKMIIVDGSTGFTGGMNVGDEYSGRARWKGGQTFHDTHLQIEGPAVHDLAVIFEEDWAFATDEHLSPPTRPKPLDGETSVVAAVPSGPDQEVNANAMVYFTGIASAREKVWLTSPYFIPDETVVRALVSAAMRGVDVRVLVPEKSDVIMMGPAGRSYFTELLKGGVKVYQYTPSMLHAKTIVVDGSWGIVGSANVDIRSFRLNFEMGAMVVDPEFAALLEERFETDLESSHCVTLKEMMAYHWHKRLLYGIIRLFSPVL